MGRLEEGVVVWFVDFGNIKLIRKEMVYKIPFNTNSDFISDKAANDVGQVCSAGRDGH